MCGIVGFAFGKYVDGNKNDATIRAMANELNHRGPDDTGVWQNRVGNIFFAHKRLSIQDLSPAGHQPMQSVSGRYMIVFNGEIYNHNSLRDDLGLKVNWKGHSDTETILAGFEVWGIEETIRKLIGMFAIAVWDNLNSVLSLIRDRAGEKPLYYGWIGSGDQAVFSFSSELKAFKKYYGFRGSVDKNALCSYMRSNNIGGDLSIYENIKKLLPGRILTISFKEKVVGIKKYWSMEKNAKYGIENRFDYDEREAIQHLDSLLRKTISQQMLSDVPLGAFLSGGVDSSTIVALMQSQSSRPVKTFTIGFGEKKYNEAMHAKSVANYLGTDHTELYLTPEDVQSVIPRISSIYDEPFADSSQIPTFLVSQLARSHVTVALSGDAGDELFGGYNRYLVTEQAWAKLSQVPYLFRRALSALISSLPPDLWTKLADMFSLSKNWVDFGYKLHKGAGVLGARNVGELYKGLITHWDRPDELVLGGKEGEKYYDNAFDGVGFTDVEKMMIYDLLMYLPDDILTKVDRAAMAVSLETRVPFLDHRVMEFAWQLPMEYKLRKTDKGIVTKWILRQVLYNYVPKEMIERPKMGFGIPIDSWLRGPLKNWAADLLSEKNISGKGYLNAQMVQKKWQEHLSGKRNWHHQLWCVLMFQAWLEHQAI